MTEGRKFQVIKTKQFYRLAELGRVDSFTIAIHTLPELAARDAEIRKKAIRDFATACYHWMPKFADGIGDLLLNEESRG